MILICIYPITSEAERLFMYSVIHVLLCKYLLKPFAILLLFYYQL